MNIPSFIQKDLEANRTSLGDNPAIPMEDDYPVLKKIVFQELNKTEKDLHSISWLKSNDIDYLSNQLNTLITETKKKEEPIKKQLENICFNAVVNMFAVPDSMINFQCNLVSNINPTFPIRIRPEGNDIINYDFPNLEDFGNAKQAVLKRRFINSLILGSSYSLASENNEYAKNIAKYDKSLINRYHDIMTIDRYLLFKKKSNITEKKLCQSGLVEVVVNNANEKNKIFSQALLFPYLLVESIRGFMEMFSTKGLPKETKRAEFIVREADFMKAEPWDMRLGVGLWSKITDNDINPSLIPFFFADLCKLNISEFNSIVPEMIANTHYGKELRDNMINNASYQFQDNEYYNDKKLKSTDKTILTDSDDYSIDDLDKMQIQEKNYNK